MHSAINNLTRFLAFVALKGLQTPRRRIRYTAGVVVWSGKLHDQHREQNVVWRRASPKSFWRYAPSKFSTSDESIPSPECDVSFLVTTPSYIQAMRHQPWVTNLLSSNTQWKQAPLHPIRSNTKRVYSPFKKNPFADGHGIPHIKGKFHTSREGVCQVRQFLDGMHIKISFQGFKSASDSGFVWILMYIWTLCFNLIR